MGSRYLEKITLIVSIFLVLMCITATWNVVDTYQKYGWSWEVTVIGMKGSDVVMETRQETVAGQVFGLLFLVGLTVLNVANYYVSGYARRNKPENSS